MIDIRGRASLPEKNPNIVSTIADIFLFVSKGIIVQKLFHVSRSRNFALASSSLPATK
jgi:hypothetical protein